MATSSFGTSKLLDQILSTGNRQTTDETKKKIIQMLNCEENGIKMDHLMISLKCPIMKTPMKIPSRSKTCSHLQCFELENYFNLNQQKPTWKCPICNGNAHYDNLIIDQYFMDLLETVEYINVEEVQLLPNGNWRILEANTSKEQSHATIITLADNNEQDNMPSECSLQEYVEQLVISKLAKSGLRSNGTRGNRSARDSNKDHNSPPPNYSLQEHIRELVISKLAERGFHSNTSRRHKNTAIIPPTDFDEENDLPTNYSFHEQVRQSVLSEIAKRTSRSNASRRNRNTPFLPLVDFGEKNNNSFTNYSLEEYVDEIVISKLAKQASKSNTSGRYRNAAIIPSTDSNKKNSHNHSSEEHIRKLVMAELAKRGYDIRGSFSSSKSNYRF